MAEEFDPVLAEAQAQVLREELTQYDLDEEDFGLLELELDEEFHDGYRPSPPVLAIVGRPESVILRSNSWMLLGVTSAILYLPISGEISLR